MHNHCTDADKITAAYKSNLISEYDYQKYLACQGYKLAIKKSLDCGELSNSVANDEFKKADSVYFLRDQSKGILRYVLHGADFQPMDLLPKRTFVKSQEFTIGKTSEPKLIKSNTDRRFSKSLKILDDIADWVKAQNPFGTKK